MLKSVWKIAERRGLKEKDKESLERNERERLGATDRRNSGHEVYTMCTVCFDFPREMRQIHNPIGK